MSNIKIKDISRHFGENIALEQINLEVREGEFFSLLGPSGCGKSTLLNIIAGILEPTSGAVSIDGHDVTGVPTYKRNIGMVFQNYALFPHLTVFGNVAYGLRSRKVPKNEIRNRVYENLSLVKLEAFADRMPHQLSGGQQQRVAVARALAIKPTVLLLDEPLSNLDAQLRKQMQFELRDIQERVGITTVLVTHDQEEALSLSDRIAVLGEGYIQQVDPPLEAYRRPSNQFVAEFIGQVNLFVAKLSEDNNNHLTYSAVIRGTKNETPLKLSINRESVKENIESPLLMLRPERIRIASKPLNREENQVTSKITDVSYIGNSLRIIVSLGEGELMIHVTDTLFPKLPVPGEMLNLYWEAEDLIALGD